MEGKKNLCAMIPAELHARIMAEKEEMKLGTLAEYVERIFAEHFEGGNDMQTERTLAVKISAELFDRLKEYLEKNHLKQKDFITQLLQQALDNAEEFKAPATSCKSRTSSLWLVAKAMTPFLPVDIPQFAPSVAATSPVRSPL